MRHVRVVASALILAAAAAARAADASDVAPALQEIAKLHASGDLDGAAKRAAELVAKHPDVLEARLADEDAKLALGRDKEVVEACRAAAKASDATADTHYLCARVLRGGAAVAEYRAALGVDPKHFWSMCGLGVELTRMKNYVDAKAALDDAAKLRPESAAPVNALGRIEEARGRKDEAEKLYRAAVALDPSLTAARVNLGMLLVATSKQDDAKKTLNEAARLAPKDPLPLLGLGMAYMAAKDMKSAVEEYRRALELASDDVVAQNLLANAYLDLDQRSMADDALQKALKKAPGSVTTQVNLAYVHVLGEDYEGAAKLAQSAVQADDLSADAHYLLGLAYDFQIQPKKADVEFRRAEKLDEENPAFAHALAAFAAGQGDWKTAVAEGQKYAKMTNNAVPALMDLAVAYVGAGKAKDAASTYDRVVAADPNNTAALLQLGIVCMRDLKEMKRASKAFHDFQGKGGKDPRVPLWIIQCDTAK